MKDEKEQCLYFMLWIQQQLRKEKAENFAVAARVRDEVTREFSGVIFQIQQYYSEHIPRERELIEERCEWRQDDQAAQSCLVTSNLRDSTMLHDREKRVTELSELLCEYQNQQSLKSKKLETQS